ncbi:MAG: hypothetical protein ACJ8F7_06945 [Gemmataceae bacterium]
MSLNLRWLACVALVAVGVPALGQESPLGQLPAGAPIVIQVRGAEQAQERLKATITAATPEFGPMIANELENGISRLLSGRELKALAKDGPVFVVFTEVPTGDEERPDLAVVARVTNYVQFRDAFLKDDERKELKADKAGYEIAKIDDQTAYFLNRGEYAVVSASEKAIKAFATKTAESLSARLTGPLAAKLLGADVAAFVDVRAVRKQHGDSIAAAKQALDQALEQAEGAGGIDKAQIQQAGKIFGSLFQLIEDTDQVVVSADFRPEGLMLRLHTQVGEKSKTNAYLKTMKPATLTGIIKLPTGAMAYSNSVPGLDLAQGLLTSMLGLGGSGESKASPEAEEALKELAGLKFEESYSSGDFPSGGIQVIRYAEPAKAVAASLKLYKSVPADSSFIGSALKGKPEVKEGEQTAHGFTLHSVRLTWNIDKMVERFPEEQREAAKETMKKMIGDGQRFWFGSDGKEFVQLTAKDWAEASKLLDAYVGGKSALGSDPAFAATRKQLPAAANTVILIDAGRMAYAMGQYVGDLLKNIPNIQIAIGQAKKPEGKPSYLGIAVTLEPRNGSLDVYVPTEGIKQIIGVLQPLFGGPAGE